MNMNWNVVAVIAAMMLYGYLAWMMCRRQIGAGMRRVRDLPRGLQALFAVVAIIATIEAQKAGTNDTNNASGGTNMMMSVGSSVPLDRNKIDTSTSVGASVPLDRNRYTSTIRTTTSIRHFSSSWIQTNLL